MSERQRIQRLNRLLMIGEHRARASARELAMAVAHSAEAADRLSRIEGLILTAGPAAAPQQVSGLAAAAQLRALLIPAATAASERLQAAHAERCAAEMRLETSRARVRRLSSLHDDARRELTDLALAREVESRPAASRRKI